MTIVEMRVHMDCAGCESKTRKALKKLKGVDDIDINIGRQKVTVMGWAEQKKVLKTVRKTGRRAELWPYPYNPEYHNFAQRYSRSQAIGYPGGTTLSSSFYNYYKHGYDGHDHGYYQLPPSAAVIDEQSSSLFSDENPHACSIM